MPHPADSRLVHCIACTAPCSAARTLRFPWRTLMYLCQHNSHTKQQTRPFSTGTKRQQTKTSARVKECQQLTCAHCRSSAISRNTQQVITSHVTMRLECAMYSQHHESPHRNTCQPWGSTQQLQRRDAQSAKATAGTAAAIAGNRPRNDTQSGGRMLQPITTQHVLSNLAVCPWHCC